MSFCADELQNFNIKHQSKHQYISFKWFIFIVTLVFVLSCCTAFMLLKINTLHNEVTHLKYTVEDISSLLHQYNLMGRRHIFTNETNAGNNNEYVNDINQTASVRRTKLEKNYVGLVDNHTNGQRSKRFVYNNGYSDNTYKTLSTLIENSTSTNPPLSVRQKNKRRQDKSTESPIDEEFTPEIKDVRHKQRHRGKMQLVEDLSVTKLHERAKLLIAHFSGDTSKYVMGQHPNFKGNGYLQHPEKTYIDWIESDWVHALGMNQLYRVNNGYLTIKEAGIYFIYAQIYYLDAHDTNGYKVYVNGNAILQCTTMTHSTDRIIKGNTCFTAGVEYVNDGDLLSVADLSDGRFSLFEKGKSFFGIVKLSDLKIK